MIGPVHTWSPLESRCKLKGHMSTCVYGYSPHMYVAFWPLDRFLSFSACVLVSVRSLLTKYDGGLNHINADTAAVNKS